MIEGRNKNRIFLWGGVALFVIASVAIVSMTHPGYMIDHLRFVAGLFGFDN